MEDLTSELPSGTDYNNYYASVGGAPRHTVVIVFVLLSALSLCVILQCAFLCNCNELSNESCNATSTQHYKAAKLARFLL